MIKKEVNAGKMHYFNALQAQCVPARQMLHISDANYVIAAIG